MFSISLISSYNINPLSVTQAETCYNNLETETDFIKLLRWDYDDYVKSYGPNCAIEGVKKCPCRWNAWLLMSIRNFSSKFILLTLIYIKIIMLQMLIRLLDFVSSYIQKYNNRLSRLSSVYVIIYTLIRFQWYTWGSSSVLRCKDIGDSVQKNAYFYVLWWIFESGVKTTYLYNPELIEKITQKQIIQKTILMRR